MLAGFKRNQWLIETERLPVALLLAPVTCVTSQSVDKFVMSPILGELIAVSGSVTPAPSRRVDQSQAQSFVIRLVRCIFAVGKYGYAIVSTRIGKIKPLVGSDFKLFLVVVTALDRSDIPVVGGLLICRAQGKRSFQRSFFRLPIHDVGELYSVAGIAGGKAYGLSNGRTFRLSFNLDGYSYGAILNNMHVGRRLEIRSWLLLLVNPIHIPGGPIVWLLRLQSKLQRRREQFFVECFIEDTADVTVFVQVNSVTRIFERGLCHRKFGLAIFCQSLRAKLHCVYGIANRWSFCKKQHPGRAIFSGCKLRRHLSASWIKYAHRPGCVPGVSDVCIYNIFAGNIQWVVNNNRGTHGICVHCRSDTRRSACEYAGKLIHGQHIIVPAIGIRLRRGRAGHNVMKLPTHYQGPSVVQALQWIRP